MRTIDGRVYAEDEDARRLERVISDTLGFPVNLRVVDGRLEVDSGESPAECWCHRTIPYCPLHNPAGWPYETGAEGVT